MEDKKSQSRQVPSMPVFGTSIAVGAAALILGGYWLDQRAGGGYKRTLVGLVLALLYVAYETWKLTGLLSQTEKNAQAGEEKPPAGPSDASTP